MVFVTCCFTARFAFSLSWQIWFANVRIMRLSLFDQINHQSWLACQELDRNRDCANQTPHFSIQEGVFFIYSLKRDKERVRLMNLLKQKEFWLFGHLCCKVRSLTNVENSFHKLFSDVKLYTLRIVLAQTPYEASYKKISSCKSSLSTTSLNFNINT